MVRRRRGGERRSDTRRAASHGVAAGNPFLRAAAARRRLLPELRDDHAVGVARRIVDGVPAPCDEPRRLWVRRLADPEARPLAGTDGVSSMFWSPDGRSLAYFAAGKLRRIDLRGGAPLSICDVREAIGFSGTWGADGQILFSSIEGEAIWRVPAGGGTPVALLKADPSAGLRATQLAGLPARRPALSLPPRERADGSGHLMIAESGSASREVRPMQSNAAYVAPGFLVFAADGALLAQRFDAAKGTVNGDPFSVAEEVFYFYTTSVAGFAASHGGTVIFTGHGDEQRLISFDRNGRNLGAIGARGRYQSPRFSPDGRRLAFDRASRPVRSTSGRWTSSGNSETRLTFGQSSEGGTVWNPDGRSMFFVRTRARRRVSFGRIRQRPARPSRSRKRNDAGSGGPVRGWAHAAVYATDRQRIRHLAVADRRVAGANPGARERVRQAERAVLARRARDLVPVERRREAMRSTWRPSLRRAQPVAGFDRGWLLRAVEPGWP